MSGRLNYIQDHELAIQTILEELGCLERHVSSGSQFDEHNIRDLQHCLERLTSLLNGAQQRETAYWEADEEPLPSWLRPKSDDEERELRQVTKKT